jgi:hypothetical protein
MKRRALPLATLTAVVAALALAACGGSAEPGGSQVAALDDGGQTATETGSATTSSSTDPQDVLLEFAQCMREHGIDVPDPDFSGGGPGGGLFGGEIDPDDPDFQAAQQACQPILQQIQGQFSEEDRQALEDTLLEFAQCMRGHGVDVPDPDFSGGGPGGGDGGPFGGEIDPDDPDVQAAMEACQDILQDIGGPFGGGPGGGGNDDES